MKRAVHNALVVENVEWARGIAAQVVRGLPTWFTLDDLVGPAELGLVMAAEKFNPVKGVPFRAYAKARICGECYDSVKRREYRERTHASLASDANLFDSSPDPETQVLLEEQQELLWERVDCIPAENAQVIRWFYEDGLTLVQIATRLGCAESWARRLHRKGLVMLRRLCRDLRAERPLAVLLASSQALPLPRAS